MRSIHTAVVTGPTGAIGHALCARLLQEGIAVYAVCRPGSLRADSLPEGAVRVDCDIAALSALPKQLPQADAFFHLAWTDTTGAGRNDLDAQIRNIQYTLGACRAAAALGCQVFVGAGSQAEYGRTNHALQPDTPCFPENGYGMAKLCAGQMSRAACRRLGVAHMWPRILSVYGPYDGKNTMIMSAIRTLLAGNSPALTAGTQLWDYLYADDAAEAFFRIALFGRDGAIYPLGSGAARPLREFCEIMRDAIDPTVPLNFGIVPYGAEQVMHLEADLRSLAEDVDFVPQTSFESGIRKTVDWVRKSGSVGSGHGAPPSGRICNDNKTGSL